MAHRCNFYFFGTVLNVWFMQTSTSINSNPHLSYFWLVSTSVTSLSRVVLLGNDDGDWRGRYSREQTHLIWSPFRRYSAIPTALAIVCDVSCVCDDMLAIRRAYVQLLLNSLHFTSFVIYRISRGTFYARIYVCHTCSKVIYDCMCG